MLYGTSQHVKNEYQWSHQLFICAVLRMSRSCQGHLPHSIQVRRSNLFAPCSLCTRYTHPITVSHQAQDSLSSMSSTNFSSSSASRFQLILNSALQDYTKETGVDLTKYDFASQLERCRSPDEVLMLLRNKAREFKEYRDGNRKLINWITPVVQFIHVFAGFLGEATSIVSRKAFKPFERLF